MFTFSYDPTTAILQYALKVGASELEMVQAVWLHSGTPEKPGAGRHQLFAPRQPLTGQIRLGSRDRADLKEGKLLVRFFTRDRSGSAADVPLTFK